MTFRIVGGAAGSAAAGETLVESYETLDEAQEAAYAAPALAPILSMARLHRQRKVAHFGKVASRAYRYEGGVGPPAAKATAKARPCLALPRCQYEQVVSVPEGKIVVAIVQQEQPPEVPLAPVAKPAKTAKPAKPAKPAKAVNFS